MIDATSRKERRIAEIDCRHRVKRVLLLAVPRVGGHRHAHASDRVADITPDGQPTTETKFKRHWQTQRTWASWITKILEARRACGSAGRVQKSKVVRTASKGTLGLLIARAAGCCRFRQFVADNFSIILRSGAFPLGPVRCRTVAQCGGRRVHRMALCERSIPPTYKGVEQ